MKNLLLTFHTPLENAAGRPYSGMAFDGGHLYICSDIRPAVYRMDVNGCFREQLPTEKCYRSLCYDPRGQCFWAIAGTSRPTICRLSRSLRETDSFTPHLPRESFYTCIAHGDDSDTLLLSGPDVIVGLSKQGDVLAEYPAPRSDHCLAAAEFHGSLLRCTSYLRTAAAIISITGPNHCRENLTCLPLGHTAVSFCPEYAACGDSGLFVLSTKGSRYSHLLYYQYIETGGPRSGPDLGDGDTCIRDFQL